MNKILVANRGEIALRIMRTVKRMGIKTVAVFSEADRESPHVFFADEAICIGAAPSSQSYLDAGKILDAAKLVGADGIHPGYGFLSENAMFAEKVEAAGISFIGPGAEAIRIMGSKLEAKRCVKKYDIPMVPGLDHAIADVAEAKKVAAQIGYPVLIKASAGGGGKGMRIVNDEQGFEAQMDRAMSEALAAFGDGAVFIEKYVSSPRHIEVQVLADKFGNTVHLPERECSIQRRHQKVVEESPSAILTPELTRRMGEAAVLVAKSCNYSSTGTVEFLLDDALNFYFLEMNTRLQVEHPVTEMITGIDLVEQQVRIARGEKLAIAQGNIVANGHAIELRVYAEDPAHDFMPSAGKLNVYQPPAGPGIRVDDGYRQGMDVPVYYDPMLAKLLVHDKDRPSAIEKMKEAILAYEIEGVETNLSFGSFVLNHPAFVKGAYDTHFVKQFYNPAQIQAAREALAEHVAIAAIKFWQQAQLQLKPVHHQSTSWKCRQAS